MQRTFIWMGFFTFENFASRATDATRRDKAWDRAGKLRLVMRNRTILVAVLISPYLSQKVVGLGTGSWRISTLGLKTHSKLNNSSWYFKRLACRLASRYQSDDGKCHVIFNLALSDES